MALHSMFTMGMAHNLASLRIVSCSPDIGDIMQTLTNVKPLPRTAEDIRQAFQAADTNKDGVLTHKE